MPGCGRRHTHPKPGRHPWLRCVDSLHWKGARSASHRGCSAPCVRERENHQGRRINWPSQPQENEQNWWDDGTLQAHGYGASRVADAPLPRLATGLQENLHPAECRLSTPCLPCCRSPRPLSVARACLHVSMAHADGRACLKQRRGAGFLSNVRRRRRRGRYGRGWRGTSWTNFQSVIEAFCVASLVNCSFSF